ncbi:MULTISPECIES: sorbosone dehydrogenase family protein [unclassified Brevibacterium]|uniref:PQQ-dependent sugar dehydrogenase n=1 Tax=unclassified Brevibacterium TaxID=2614124 RepID=UPI001BA53196|nr:PQQ-dependent sugar dehydrogenase [Brevibacterium sp. W7.2]
MAPLPPSSHPSPLSRLRTRTRTVRLTALGAAVGLALSACTAGDDPSSAPGTSAFSPSQAPSTETGSPPPLTAPEVVAENLDAPWSIAFAGSSPLVSERDTGRILELSGDRPAQVREVGTVPDVAAAGEGGLLGLAVADDVLYSYFTAADGNRIVRFPLTGDPGGLGLGEPEVLLDGIPAGTTHNGGRLAFGPDGMLYATAGDAGNSASAQDRDALSGKILRLTPDGAVPEDNPFDGSYVYSYGHRNPQGLSWDEDGTMYASEFGQNAWDELNVIEPGANYGWPEVEGMSDPGEGGEFVDPVQQWAPAEASPSGMTITGDSLLIANLRGATLREVPVTDLSQSRTSYDGEYGRLRDVVTTPTGEIWMLTNNTDGRGDPGPDDDRIIRIPAPD